MPKELSETTLNALEDVWKAATSERYQYERRRKARLPGDITFFGTPDLEFPVFAQDVVGRWGELMYAACVESLNKTDGMNHEAVSVALHLIRFMAAHGSSSEKGEKADLVRAIQACQRVWVCRPILRRAEEGHDVICTHDPECIEEVSDKEENVFDEEEQEEDDEEETRKRSRFVDDEAEETSDDESHVSATQSVETCDEDYLPHQKQRRE